MNLKEEENECYICTDPTIEHSPCQCKAPVHMNCLLEWVKRMITEVSHVRYAMIN